MSLATLPWVNNEISLLVTAECHHKYMHFIGPFTTHYAVNVLVSRACFSRHCGIQHHEWPKYIVLGVNAMD